ncbi:Glycosyl transferases group 1 [Crateriforma conspicua]|uniref:Glycosyl transferases group 1 n=1 Tax=Crateriforma conspicua TaxID=2527996 RepID=A0A5C6FZG1_9PLAN|nr:glycosyltransferase [Crateriforma conspicua]TWU67005.1 Glycosyl transferases group 1 [Crateriforma conspicua]
MEADHPETREKCDERSIRVAFVGNVVANYRKPFFEALAAKPDLSVSVFYGHAPGVVSLRKVDKISGVKMRPVAVWGTERLMAWQFLPLAELSRDFDVIVYYSNPRYISTVLFATLHLLRGKSVVLNNHYKTAGRPRLSEWVRLKWTKAFPNILVYTRQEADRMRQDGFRKHRIEGWGNGLDSASIQSAIEHWNEDALRTWAERQNFAGRPILLSVGRLIDRNQFHLIAEVLASSDFRSKFLWCIIGDGPMESSLKQLVRELGVDQSVRFCGPIHDELDLAPWFLTSKMLVHPGPIGLALIHAFNYGLPVVTHDNRRMHNPEFDAVRQNANAFLFTPGNKAELMRAIGRCSYYIDALTKSGSYEAWRQDVIEKVRTNFSTEIMAARTAEFIRDVADDQTHRCDARL